MVFQAQLDVHGIWQMVMKCIHMFNYIIAIVKHLIILKYNIHILGIGSENHRNEKEDGK